MLRGIKSVALIFSAFTLCLISTAVLADSPTSFGMPDKHSVEVKGKISSYRVQIEGLNMGDDGQKMEGEVFVSLDAYPKMVFGLKVRNDSPASNKLMATTLREAYVHKIPVTLYRQIDMKRSNFFRITMVQLN